eukprot:scpid61375/ scgid3526/ 
MSRREKRTCMNTHRSITCSCILPRRREQNQHHVKFGSHFEEDEERILKRVYCMCVDLRGSKMNSATLKALLSGSRVGRVRQFSNEMAIDLKCAQEKNSKNLTEVFEWVRMLYGRDWPEESPPDSKAVLSRVTRVVKKKIALQKNIGKPGGKDTLERFLKEDFELPGRRSSTSCQEQDSQQVEQPASITQAATQELHNDHVGDSKQWDDLQQRILSSYNRTRNITKRLRRREHALEDAAEQLRIHQEQQEEREQEAQDLIAKLEDTSKDLVSLKEKQIELAQHLRNAKRMSTYWQRKAAVAVQSSVRTENALETAQEEAAKLMQEVNQLEEGLADNDDNIHDDNEDDPTVLETMHNGRYTDGVRTCCINLLTHNVGIHHVGPVMKEVLSLAGKTPSSTPSATSVRTMLLEGRAVGLLHIGHLAGSDNTLHFDGTTKHGHKYGSFQLTTDDGQFTLAVSEALSGSAEHTMELLHHTIGQLGAAGEKLGDAQSGNRLIAALKNTMSDRAAVNTKFNNMLQVCLHNCSTFLFILKCNLHSKVLLLPNTCTNTH